MKKKQTANPESKAKTYVIVSNDGCGRGLIAYAIMKKLLQKKTDSGKSAAKLYGLVVAAGQTLDPLALAVLRKRGFSVSGIRPQQVSEDGLKGADTAICLSTEDLNYLRNTYKNIPSEIFALDIPAVVERTEAAFEKAFGQIEKAIGRSRV